MNVLLCLLSDQHVPNLLSVHHFRPDRLVLVETRDMKRKNVAAHFLEALRLGGLTYDDRYEIAPLEAEDSLQAAQRALGAAYARYPSARWIANLTGGTKPMSLATYVLFKERNARLVYTNVARPGEILDIDAETKEVCQHRLTIKEFVGGYGFESRKADARIAEAEDRARTWWACARGIATQGSRNSLLPLSDQDRDRARKKGWTLAPGQLKHDDESVLRTIAEAFALDPEDRSGKVSRHAAEFLTGGWLEVFFWGLVERHADALGCWDVRLGLDVGRRGDASGNDLDVAFLHEHRLSVLECKSGSQGHDKGGDVLYKVEAVTRQFRALRVQSYLATTAENIADSGGEIKTNIRNRAEIYNCRILTAAMIRRLAVESGNLELIRGTLFGSKSPNAREVSP
jgi:hypothetical protein